MNFLRREASTPDDPAKDKKKTKSRLTRDPKKDKSGPGASQQQSAASSGDEKEQGAGRSMRMPSARNLMGGGLFGSSKDEEARNDDKTKGSAPSSRVGGGKSLKSKRKTKSSMMKSSAPRGFQGTSSMMEYKSTTLGQQLTEATADDSLADVTFVVGPERKICKGLRIVMAARNKYLRKMLYDTKNEDGSLKTTFELPKTHGMSFDLMIKFIHSGGLTWEPHQTVQLLEVSIDFEVNELMKKCMELVAESMTDALSLAELTKLIQILLRGEGFDVNLQHPKTGTSALHIASREGGLDLVNDLLSRGANLRWTDINGSTALHLARNQEVAQVLITANADINQLDKGGNPPLVYAIVNKREEVRDLLLGTAGCKEHLFKTTQDAVEREMAALNKGPTPITEVKMSQTPEALVKKIEEEAAAYPQLLAPPNLIEVARIGSIWGTRTALARGEDVNQRDEKEAARLSMPGYTALHWAAATGHIGVVQCLLAAEDVDVNPSDTEMDNGYTPLQLCVNYKQRQWEQCMYLMQAHGAKLDAFGEDESDSEEEEEEVVDKSNRRSASFRGIAPGMRTGGIMQSIFKGISTQASRFIRPGASLETKGARRSMRAGKASMRQGSQRRSVRRN